MTADRPATKPTDDCTHANAFRPMVLMDGAAGWECVDCLEALRFVVRAPRTPTGRALVASGVLRPETAAAIESEASEGAAPRAEVVDLAFGPVGSLDEELTRIERTYPRTEGTAPDERVPEPEATE